MIVSDLLGVITELVFLIFYPLFTERLADYCVHRVKDHWEYLLRNLVSLSDIT